LASIRYERSSDGRLKYLPAIDRHINRIGERLQSAQANGGSGHTVDRIEKERKDWAQLRFIVRELLALTPSGVLSASEMAGRCRSFLIRWGPTDAPPQDKADRTIDESARNRLVDQFSALDGAQIAYRAPTARLNRYMTNMVRSDKVRATRPLPGKIHVAPLESAAYANRSHLYVMGLDATSTGQFMHEAHLTLSDDERERISSATGAALVQLGGAPGLKAWKVEQVRTRHTGDLSLMMRTFDLREGEERHPSPIYLRWGGKEAEAAQKRPIELANRSHGYLPLDETGDWLRAQTAALQGDLPGEGKARREEGVRHAQGPQNAQDNESPVGTVPVSNGQAPGPSFAALYPGAAQGLEAERQRVSDTYTAFDGLLTGEGYPDLDVFDGERVVSASRLERLANTPYLYFLRHVLRVRPLDEPALEETGWLDPLQRGSILHDAFETFVRQLGGRAPEAGDEPALRHALKDRYEDEIDRIPPSGTFIENKTWQELWADARIFLRAETESDHDGTPYKLEYGFGLPPDRRSQDGKERPARLTFDNGTAITLRGQIDRIDEHPDGTFSIWDYKTGRSMSYNESDLLQDGKVLQWALYSYAFEALEQVDVREAGYFFASAQELGRRISSGGRPARYRQEVSEALDRLAELARTGTFPPNLNHYSWRYSGFERCIPGMKKRTKAMRRKEWPEGRPTPIHLL
jgi:RecB family exonuclease